MKEYFLQADKPLQADAPWDVPSISQEKQTMVDEDQINESLQPANDAFSFLNDLGDWIVDFFTDFFGGLFGTIM